jgi:hypothetical protein
MTRYRSPLRDAIGSPSGCTEELQSVGGHVLQSVVARTSSSHLPDDRPMWCPAVGNRLPQWGEGQAGEESGDEGSLIRMRCGVDRGAVLRADRARTGGDAAAVPANGGRSGSGAAARCFPVGRAAGAGVWGCVNPWAHRRKARHGAVSNKRVVNARASWRAGEGLRRRGRQRGQHGAGASTSAKTRARGTNFRPRTGRTARDLSRRRLCGALTFALGCGVVREAAQIKGLAPWLLDGVVGSRSNTRPSGGQVAQLVEQRTENPRVGGSIPPLATSQLIS